LARAPHNASPDGTEVDAESSHDPNAEGPHHRAEGAPQAAARGRLAAGKAWQDSGLVFTSPIGTPLDPRNVTREFQAMLKAANLHAIRFHDLRHTAATLLLSHPNIT
jgi:integrase